MDRLRDRPIELDGLSVELRLEDDLRAWRHLVRVVRGRIPKRLPTGLQFMVYVDGQAMHVDVEATRSVGDAIAWDLYMHRQELASGPDPLSERFGWAHDLGSWIERAHRRKISATLSCSATFECDLRRSTSRIIMPQRVPKEIAPPEGLAAQIYSLGIEQEGRRIWFDVDRSEETLTVGIGFEVFMESLEDLFGSVEEEARMQIVSWVSETPDGTIAKER